MVAGTKIPAWGHERRRAPRDLQMLELCRPNKAFWTNELALLGNVPTHEEAYRLLADLEQRHLIKRIVRLGLISWQRTILGDLIAMAVTARSF